MVGNVRIGALVLLKNTKFSIDRAKNQYYKRINAFIKAFIKRLSKQCCLLWGVCSGVTGELNDEQKITTSRVRHARQGCLV